MTKIQYDNFIAMRTNDEQHERTRQMFLRHMLIKAEEARQEQQERYSAA